MKYGVCLIGNYRADQQESMIRYANHLEEMLKNNGVPYLRVEPEEIWGNKFSNPTISKYLRYVDKYLFFKSKLRTILLKLNDSEIRWIVHIVDHSNAVYVHWIKDFPTLVTCHDVGAIQGARGELEDCRASFLGKILQGIILSGLVKATQRVAVSAYTKANLVRLGSDENKGYLESNTKVILNPIRPEIAIHTDTSEIDRATIFNQQPVERYLLNVSSNLRRKNRSVVMRVFAQWRASEGDKLVFVGERLSEELRAEAKELGIQENLIDLGAVSNEVLANLYRGAFAFLFPSRFEGFGWPIIEAQYHEAPVISACNSAIPEVAGEGAFLCDSENIQKMLEELDHLKDHAYRAERVKRGLENVKRFSAEQFEVEYLKSYQMMACVI